MSKKNCAWLDNAVAENSAEAESVQKIWALEHPNIGNWMRGLQGSRRELAHSLALLLGGGVHQIRQVQQLGIMNRAPGRGHCQHQDANRAGLHQRVRSGVNHNVNQQNMQPQPHELANNPYSQPGSQSSSPTSNFVVNPPQGYPPTLVPTTTYQSPTPYQPTSSAFTPSQGNRGFPHQPVPYPNMASNQLNNPQHGLRTRISSSDLVAFAQQAAARNASGTFDPKVNTSSGGDSYSPHDPFAILSPLPNPLPQRANNSSGNHFTSSSAQSDTPRALRSSRAREIQSGIGYHTGLDANMPSQLPRNPQEAEEAARRHASRVRAMQRNLAADPNVMMPRLPGAPTQMVAIGPPLTGHDTQSAITLPSVLNPIMRQPMMTYQQSLDAIFGETGPLLLRLSTLEPRAVSCVLYGPNNQLLTVAEGLVLTKECNIKKVITLIQALVDKEIPATHPAHEGSRFIVMMVEIRIGVTDGSQGYPPLKGVCVEGDKGNWAMWVKWVTHGDMEKYWEAYRCMLQTQTPTSATALKPIFKVTCVRQISDDSAYPGGHEFYEVPGSLPPVPTIAAIAVCGSGAEHVGDRFGASSICADKSSEISADSEAFISDSSDQTAVDQYESDSGSRETLNQNFSQMHFDGAVSISEAHAFASGSFGGEFGHDGGGVVHDVQAEIAELLKMKEMKKDKAKEVDLKANWGYYQRMGCDPEVHKLYPLSHVPFEVDPKNPPPQRVDFDDPQDFSQVKNAFTGTGAEGSAPMVADGCASWNYVEAAIQEVRDREHEAAISFEDGDVFFPDADVKLPNQNDMLSSSMARKSKNKEKTKARGVANDRIFSILGNNVPKVPHKHLLPYMVPNYRELTTQASPGRSGLAPPAENKGRYPLTKVSSTMNVHAPPFTNTTPNQGSNMLSPYYSSNVGFQSSENTKPGFAQYDSAPIFGNQDTSIEKNSSPFAFQATEFKPDLSQSPYGYLVTSSPETQERQKSPHHRKRSPQKPDAYINHGSPSLDKSSTRQSFNAGSHHALKIGASSSISGNGLLASLNAQRPFTLGNQIPPPPGFIDRVDQTVEQSRLQGVSNAGGLSFIGGEGNYGGNYIAAMTGGEGSVQSGPQGGNNVGPLSILDDPRFASGNRISCLTGGQGSAESNSRGTFHSNCENWIYNIGTGPKHKRDSVK